MNNPELELAWTIIETTGANLFLTGKAGTGKTTFLKNLRKHTSKRMVVLAPTGIAAINAEGVTIHSFFQLPLSPYIPGTTFNHGENKYQKFNKVKRDILRTLDLLVIDEISMVRADLLDAVDSVMRSYRDYGKPFGGVQLLLIGDLQQLSPVIKDNEWELLKSVYDTPYFFSSKALAQASYHTVELKTVYRQQDVSFISLLNKIREKKADETTLAELNKRYIPGFTPSKDSNYIRLTTHNYQAQAVNDHELAQLQSEEHTYTAEVEGVFPETSYPADKQLVLKQGAQVMFIKNDLGKRFFNGMIGEVVSLDSNSIVVKSKESGEAFSLEKAEWANCKYTIDNETKEIKETVEGVFRQYPLRLAWAITIHKSQGLTFDHAIIDISHSFAHGQAYVALSRCRTLEGIILSAPLQREAIIADSVVDTFAGNIDKYTPSEATVSMLQQKYMVQVLDELFDFIHLQSSFNMLLRTIDEHFYHKYPKLLAEYKRVGTKFSELIDVSRKFKIQYTRLAGNCIENAVLEERVRKAAVYFSIKLSEFDILCSKTKVTTDNKQLKKQFNDRFTTFVDELSLKIGLFKHERSNEVRFSVADLLSTKAKILLGKNEPETKHTKKAKTPKPPKIPTREISYNMYIGGMSIEQIANERKLTYGTIFSHLLGYVESGEIDAWQLIPQEHAEKLQEYFKSGHRPTSLAEINESLDMTMPYSEISLYMRINDIHMSSDQ